MGLIIDILSMHKEKPFEKYHDSHVIRNPCATFDLMRPHIKFLAGNQVNVVVRAIEAEEIVDLLAPSAELNSQN